MGRYLYPLNEVSAGAKADRDGSRRRLPRNFTPALPFLSGASAEERVREIESVFVIFDCPKVQLFIR